MDKTYRVNEIFYSLQGEGYHTGTPAVFLRFSGCNRRCEFCDTDHSASRPMTAADIAGAVGGFPARHIVVTGGEPALQLDSALADEFHRLGFYVQVETNGSLALPPEVDWVTCSPKDGPWNIGRVDELKVVFDGRDVEDVAKRFQAKHHFLQPLSGGNIPEVVAYCLAHPRWRLSLQTHKLIDIQ